MLNNVVKYGSKIIDWILIIAILIGSFCISKLINPYERQFRLDDHTISHPYKGDTINMVYLVIVFLASAIAVIVVIPFFKKNVKYNCHQAIIGLFLCYSATELFTNVIKVMVGRYRPDFISLCDVNFKKVQEQYNYYDNIADNIEAFGPRNLFNTSICNASQKDLIEERKSFPSGHSAFSFTIMTYLALFIAGQIHLLNKKSRAWKYIIVCIPMICALIVALSRVMDYRHHWQDVTIGS
eukprot:jgi/Orpsp1_1/1191928/evm.model.d7180000089432.1